MQKTRTYGKITTIEDDGKTYLACPRCRKSKLVRLLPGTRAVNLVVFCKRCGESVVNIPNLAPEP